MNEKEKQILDKIEKNIKELSEGEFNYELICKGSSNKDFDILIEYIEKQINFVNDHQDSKKRFEIAKGFLEKLDSDSLYNSYKSKKSKEGFADAKKVSQGSKTYYENVKKYENSSDKDKEIDSLCKMFAYSYERACRLYFKPLAHVITGKKINSCSDCIEKIIEYYPDMEFVLQPFISHIRNSIDHVDYYYKPKENIITFEDRYKPPIHLTIEILRNLCMFQMVSDVCISTADYAVNLPLMKTSQYYFNKVEEYCKILQIDFDSIVTYWASKGRNLLGLYNILEKIIEENTKSRSRI